MNKELLQKYATFTVKTAAGLLPGQTLIIRAPITAAPFARMCAQAAYDLGAREAVVHYTDESLARMKMEHATEEVVQDFKPYQQRMLLDYIESEGGAAVLSISSRNPELYKGLDAKKLQLAAIAADKAFEGYIDCIVNDRVQWTIAAVPSDSWNAKVFPELDSEQAEQRMWEAIFTCARVKGGDPEGEWEKFIQKTLARKKALNEYAFDALHLTAPNGTDLTVGLPQNHIWDGGTAFTDKGNRFIPNVPTEEIFTCPHRERVDGKVYASKPYVYNGDIIENFYFIFKDGVVTEFYAEKGHDLLESMLSVDDNAKRIGEVAIVDNDSGVGKSGLLYYNTLFDENAACHIAFGRCYPGTIKGGSDMSREQLEKAGGNYSRIHEDIMIGTSDMNIVGIMKDGSRVQLMKDGYWVI